jgi:hypothetical protein
VSTATFTRTNFSGYRVLDRDALLAALSDAGFPASFDRIVAEHVTYAYPDPTCAPAARNVRIVGHAKADGVQALLVEIDGTSARPDGKLFHLTYSLAPGRKPVESNRLLETVAIEPLTPITVDVEAF